ncbi:MAG: hypothetical protein ABIK79_15355 [Chloroflexota bacterium]
MKFTISVVNMADIRSLVDVLLTFGAFGKSTGVQLKNCTLETPVG